MTDNKNKEQEKDPMAQEAAAVQSPEVHAKPKFRDRLRERYPDEKYDEYNDDRWDELEGRYMDDTEKRLTEYGDSEKVLNDLITADEDLAMVLHEMIVNKKPFRAAVATYLSQEDLIPKDGDEDLEAYNKAYEERLERGRKRQQIREEVDANLAATMENIHSFAVEKGLSPEDENAFIAGINQLFDELVMKKVTPENVEKLYKAINYDKAVSEAEAKGEIKGRNANIEAQKATIAKKVKGDGLPNLGGGESPAPAPVKRMGFFDDMPERKEW